RRDACREAGRCRSIDSPVAAARNLVKTPNRQPALRQAAVELGEAKRQDSFRPAMITLDRCDPMPKQGESRIRERRRHGSVGLL
ncbi:hypothetical protein Q4511_16385, partial [Paracoccus sp. 1_MG-2023]|uniref:hypothetical protein n=1 Tax=Paracoccus sp. 1_MG-2023 TaxID=3062651 RepID=UPI0026E422A7